MESVEQKERKELKMLTATCSFRVEKVMFLTLKLQHTKEIK